MKVQVIGSSSSGNCYLLDYRGSRLILEAGMPIKKIKRAIGHQLSKLDGCLISHSHGDHSKAVNDLLKAGVPCFMSHETAEDVGCANHHRTHIVQNKKVYTVGPWSVMPFETIHDCPGSMGFLVQNGDEKLVFITDSAYVPFRFKGITIIMVECNYQYDILTKNLETGSIIYSQYQRIILNHFGLDNVKAFLQANDLSKVREIHLLHLSDGNSNEHEIKSEIQTLTGLPVYVAAKDVQHGFSDLAHTI